jgi:hypothetical protein
MTSVYIQNSREKYISNTNCIGCPYVALPLHVACREHYTAAVVPLQRSIRAGPLFSSHRSSVSLFIP